MRPVCNGHGELNGIPGANPWLPSVDEGGEIASAAVGRVARLSIVLFALELVLDSLMSESPELGSSSNFLLAVAHRCARPAVCLRFRRDVSDELRANDIQGATCLRQGISFIPFAIGVIHHQLSQFGRVLQG